jgi:hypothetical protein
MDVSFGEDSNHVKSRHGAENLALLRRQALMMLKRHPAKKSIKGKQMNVLGDTKFLEEVINTYENLGKI